VCSTAVICVGPPPWHEGLEVLYEKRTTCYFNFTTIRCLEGVKLRETNRATPTSHPVELARRRGRGVEIRAGGEWSLNSAPASISGPLPVAAWIPGYQGKKGSRRVLACPAVKLPSSLMVISLRLWLWCISYLERSRFDAHSMPEASLGRDV
jgi:hypothetical protein